MTPAPTERRWDQIQRRSDGGGARAEADVTTEVATDAAVDASTNITVIAATDTSVDASTKVTVNAATEATVDAAAEVTVNAATEAAVDAATDVTTGILAAAVFAGTMAIDKSRVAIGGNLTRGRRRHPSLLVYIEIFHRVC